MSYHVSNKTDASSAALGNAIAGLFVAGVTFILGYTVVRASLAEGNFAATEAATDAEVVVPHEGALWADFGKTY